MRHLNPTFLESTLRRGKVIEQFLGGYERAGARIVTWLEIRPEESVFELWHFVVPDIGDAENLDLYAFLSEEVGEPVIVLQTSEEALAYAHAELHASEGRWVNQAVSQEEYRDFIAAGRPPEWAAVGAQLFNQADR